MEGKYSLHKDGGLIAGAVPGDIIHRFEKIPTSIFHNEYEGATYLVEKIIAKIKEYEQSHPLNENGHTAEPFVLGLSTGSSPVGVYRELVKRHKNGEVSFRNVKVFSIDEFYPITAADCQSRNYSIHSEFLNHIDIKPDNIQLPDGTIPMEHISDYCAEFDKSIRKIDLMILGVGEQGQIGFNEPGSYAKSRTRLVQLSYNSRKVHSDAFGGLRHTPTMAITVGLSTVSRAKEIILMAWGEHKSDVIQRMVEGEISDLVPASHLQSFSGVEVVIDEDAAQNLTCEQTPWLVGPCNWTPKFVRKAKFQAQIARQTANHIKDMGVILIARLAGADGAVGVVVVRDKFLGNMRVKQSVQGIVVQQVLSGVAGRAFFFVHAVAIGRVQHKEVVIACAKDSAARLFDGIDAVLCAEGKLGHGGNLGNDAVQGRFGTVITPSGQNKVVHLVALG